MKYKAMVQTFSIETGFLKSEYEVLKKIGTYQTLGEGRFRWTFPLALWDQVVVALGGQVVEFDQDHLTRDVLSRCVALKKEVELTLKRHGKGKITVMVEEEYYRLSKPHDGSISVAIVSKALVEVLWDDVVSKMPKGEPTPPRRWPNG